VFASNSIAFIKDTSKEDHEKLMIDEWEAKDEGRSLRAVKSRKKYLLYEKAQRNDVLNTEENKELNEERERRKANQIDHIEEEETTNANANVKGVKGRDNKRKRSLKVKEPVNKKGNVKGKQTDKDKNDKPQEDEYGIHSNLFRCILKNRELSMKNIFQTPLPKCEESKSQYILNYIKYTYRNRSITKTPTARNGNTINDNIILADDNYRNTVKRNILNKYEEYAIWEICCYSGADTKKRGPTLKRGAFLYRNEGDQSSCPGTLGSFAKLASSSSSEGI
jgi:hypothetical protein